MWEDLNGGRCNMVDACARPETAEQVFEMHMKNFNRHFNSNRAVFPLFFHSAWFNVPHLREGFLAFLDHITSLQDVWLVTAWQAIQWMRDPQPLDNINQFKPFGCQSKARASHCLNPRRCKLPHGTGIRYMSTCQGCPSRYPWTGDTGVKRPWGSGIAAVVLEAQDRMPVKLGNSCYFPWGSGSADTECEIFYLQYFLWCPFDEMCLFECGKLYFVKKTLS